MANPGNSWGRKGGKRARTDGRSFPVPRSKWPELARPDGQVPDVKADFGRQTVELVEAVCSLSGTGKLAVNVSHPTLEQVQPLAHFVQELHCEHLEVLSTVIILVMIAIIEKGVVHNEKTAVKGILRY